MNLVSMLWKNEPEENKINPIPIIIGKLKPRTVKIAPIDISKKANHIVIGLVDITGARKLIQYYNQYR